MKKLVIGAHAPQNHTKNHPLKQLIIGLAFTTLSQFSMAQSVDTSNDELSLAKDKVISYTTSTIIPNQYIVVFKDEKVTEKAELLTLNGNYSMKDAKKKIITELSVDMATKASGSLERTYTSALSGFVLKSASKKAVEFLAKDDRVAFIEYDQTVSIEATQNNATWGLDRIDQANLPLNSTYVYDQNGTGVNAYVVDTGVRTSHSQFGGRATSGYTAINDGNGANDCNGHGTHVAGTVGSSTYGVAKNVNIVAVRVLDCAGSGSNSGVLAGIDWVAANHIKPAVANMSLGGGSSTALDNAVNAAVAAGVTMVVAAGNENQNACNVSPARAANAITVGSTTSSDSRSSFSNYGSCLDIYAPGSSITSTWYTSNSSINTISGTSMASPHVAGVVALYLDENPNASPSQVQSALESAAIANKVSDARSGSPNLLLNNDFGGGTPPPPPTGGTLTNGVAKTGLSGATGSQANFTLAVPTGATNLTFNMSGGSGDADLYVKFGSAPTTSSYDCRPYVGGNSESCPVSSAQTGTYYVMIRGYSAYSNVSLVGSYTASSGGGQSLFTNNNNVNIPDNNPTGATSNINVSRNGNSNTIKISYNIVHTYRGDLKIEIFAPNGASAVLREPSGGGTDNIIDSNTLNASTTPANGTWKLKVIDNAGADVGYINSWSIEFL